MTSWHDNDGGRDLRPLPFFLYLLALAVAVVLVAGASNARGGPADLCPPPAHLTAGDACLPCTPAECRLRAAPVSPATWIRCRVVLRTSRGGDYVQATGILTSWDVDPEGGWEYAELDGEIDHRGTGPVQYLTTKPPIEMEVLWCPPSAPSSG